MDLHPYVSQLVRAVARFMYRDEFIIILDMLSRKPFIREDRLERVLGLAQKHSVRLLQELETERLVSYEDVSEKGIRKRDREGGALAQERELEAELAGSAAAAAADDLPEDTRKVKTRVWYINPRYFVDVVRYKIHIIREVLRKQESQSLQRQSMYSCTSARCVYEASTADAMKHMMASVHELNSLSGSQEGGGLLARRAASLGIGAAAAPSFLCPACGSTMRKKDGRAVMAAAENRLDNFNSQLSASGIADCLRSLNGVALGANRPSDKIEEKLVTMHAADKFGYKVTGNANDTYGRGHTSGVAAFGTSADQVSSAEVVVKLTGAEGDAAPTSSSIPEKRQVAVSSMPDFLRQSAFTGQTAQSVGFLRTADDVNHSAEKSAAAPSTANFFALLSQMQLDSAQAMSGGEVQQSQANDHESAVGSESDDDGWS